MGTILYLSPGVGGTPERKARLEAFANQCLTNPTANRVICYSIDEGPVSIESCIEGELSIPGMLKKAIQKRGEYDAVVIGCTDDPGLFALRELLDVPVVGPFQASIELACELGEKYSIVTILEDGFPETRMILRNYGVEQKCASVRAIGFTVAELNSGEISQEQITAAFLREAKAAQADGASSIVLGCMSMALQKLDEVAKGKIEALVMNPIKIGVKTAEMLISLGLSHSRLSYPKPDMAKLQRTVLPGLKNWT